LHEVQGEKGNEGCREAEIKPGRPAAKGKCTECDTGMYKILPKDAA